MSFRNDRFNQKMLSIDTSTIDMDKNRNFSDEGLGVNRVLDAIDYGDKAETEGEKRIGAEFRHKLRKAKSRLKKAGKGHLIRVLLLIVKNIENRQESIFEIATSKKSYKSSKTWNAARKMYFEHRFLLFEFFKK